MLARKERALTMPPQTRVFDGPAHRIGRLAHLLIVGTPEADRGGFFWPATATGVWILVILRATFLGYLFAFLPIPLFGTDYINHPAGRAWASIAFVGFEELARWSFGLSARRPIRAWVFFLVAIQLFETVAYAYTGMATALAENRQFVTPGVYLLSRAPAMAVHVIATIWFIVAWQRDPTRMVWPLALVTAGHVLFDYLAPTIVSALTGLDHVGAHP